MRSSANNMFDIVEGYRKRLSILGRNKKIIVLSADVTKASGADAFRGRFPERFLNVGIAEQNQMGIAAGLAARGFIPIAHTFAVFATMRACEQVRTTICYPNLNVKIIGAKGGLSDSHNGATHHGVEDLSITRAFPNLVIMNPVDARQAGEAIAAAVRHRGPVYIRLNSVSLPQVSSGVFKIGRPEVMRKGSGPIVFIGTGDVVYQCLRASDILQKGGISTSVVSVPTLSPIEKGPLIRVLKGARYAVTVETNNINGGLGSCIAEIISENGLATRLIRKGINNQYTQSGSYVDLLDKYGLSAERLVSVVLKLAGGFAPRT